MFSPASRFSLRPKHLKAIFSLLLLALVYASVSWQPLFARLRSITFFGLLQLLVLYTAGQILSAIKWRVFISSVGMERPFPSILRAYFFGMFVNVFGFGTLGGDLARALAIKPEKGERAPAVATVIADRIHGLCILLFIGVSSLFILSPPRMASQESSLLWLGASGLLGLVVAWWIGPQFLTALLPKDKAWAQSLMRLAAAFPRDKKRIFQASIISFAFHNIQIFMHLIMARELLAPLTSAEIYSTVPFVNIGSSIPVSVMGVGVREGLYSVLFSPLGVPQEIAVGFGALWILTTTLVSALGAIAITPEMKSDVLLGISRKKGPEAENRIQAETRSS